MSSNQNLNCDLLVIGSGAGGLSAAVTAAHLGMKVIVLEKEPVYGGTSAWSGGWLWIPRNFLAQKAGIQEDINDPIEYLKNEADNMFQKTQDLNKYLIQKLIIQKEDNIYLPTNKYKDLFIINKYHGKTKGIKFKNEFIYWIENYIKKNGKPHQSSLF